MVISGKGCVTVVQLTVFVNSVKHLACITAGIF
jgi:hypothetical protein